ncbi:FtsX-like permease family protein, partial [Angustibacter peucedani]
GDTGRVTVRADDLALRRGAPLAEGLLRLADAYALLLALLGGRAVVLAAALDAPARLERLARLRTSGLTRGDARRVLLAELVPPVAVAAAVGAATGALWAMLQLPRLAVDRITGASGGTDVVVPWWVAVVPVLLAVVAVAVARAESSAQRRASLGQVLRVGG